MVHCLFLLKKTLLWCLFLIYSVLSKDLPVLSKEQNQLTFLTKNIIRESASGVFLISNL